MSQTTPVLVNKAGLFNSTRWNALLSVSSRDRLRATLALLEAEDAAAGPIKPATAKLRAAQHEVLALLDTLPTADVSQNAHHVLLDTGLAKFDGAEHVLLVPALAGNFLTALTPHLIIHQSWSEDPEAWGLPVVRDLVARQKALIALAQDAWSHIPKDDRPQSHQYHDTIKTYELAPTDQPYQYQATVKSGHYSSGYGNRGPRLMKLPTPLLVSETALKAAKRLADMIDKEEIHVRSESAVDNLASAHAFAIYGGWARGSGGYGATGAGYLDGRGNFVDGVGGARLFESAKSAETTIRSRSLRESAVVVAVDVQVTGLAPGHSAGGFEKLGEVVSALSRQKLMDIIARSRGDDLLELKARVAEREAELAAAGIILAAPSVVAEDEGDDDGQSGDSGQAVQQEEPPRRRAM